MQNAIIYDILAHYNGTTIRVYQAYSEAIANEIRQNGNFGSSFKMGRMTWIKPSFLWMMYRSGWARKEGQTRILAIDLHRQGFDRILNSAVLSSYNQTVYGTRDNWETALSQSEVRCQWDPERDIWGNPLKQRTIQLGIKGEMVHDYINEWIQNITDITDQVVSWRDLIAKNKFDKTLLPIETHYPFYYESGKS